MSRAKRHHYVPAAYLARFGEGGSVLVRRRRRPAMYATSVKNVAVESGFYEVLGDDGLPSDAIERGLAGLEGEAIMALREVEQSQQAPPIGSSARSTLATFLAVQFTRTPLHRERIMFPERVARYAGSREIDAALMAEYLEREHLGFSPRDSEVRAALDLTQYLLRERELFTKDNAIRLAFSTVEAVEQVMLRMRWSLEVARKPRLITSDAPLVLWRAPTPRDQFEGFGLENAEEVRFPISPAMQLLLTHQAREPVTWIEPERVRACNADMTLACYQVVVGHPRRERQLELLNLPPRRPVIRFNTGPGYRVKPDGTEDYMGEILHSWVPRR
ncbi:DUF4238 domain-containing protein [Micromonospora sp. CA-263727]|uniref:DUF4238 domain-containing protein n=1 Tax=Micromonospora sp. CA-263727 TaxID=3239967 RepID=UPI003D90708A